LADEEKKMNKKEKEAVRLVLEELTRRLPKTKKHGFMLEESSDVSKAFEYLIEQVSVPSKSKEQEETK
jgi:hypothetical protein